MAEKGASLLVVTALDEIACKFIINCLLVVYIIIQGYQLIWLIKKIASYVP